MKLRTIITGISVLIPLAVAHAQDENIPNIVFDTARTSVVQPTPIAVDSMKYIGTTYITAADSAMMSNVTTVVQDDIDFYNDFELIRPDPFFMRTYEIATLDLLAWKRLGAAYVLRLEAEFPGAAFRAQWRLFDAAHQQEIAKGVQSGDPSTWREIAHDISNEIVRTLTGERGVYRTKIAYIRQIGKSKDIFMSDYDGANERQITNMNTINLSPCFSPDGNDIYFTSFRDGDPQIFKVNVNTNKVSKITSYPGMVQAPAVAPDGVEIACVMTKDGNSEIYVIDTLGRIIKRLTHNPAIDSGPTWSPDAHWLAFASDRTGFPQIYIMDSDGMNVHRVTFQGNYNDSPVWSDRGDRITFVSRTETGRFNIASIDTSGNGARIMTTVGFNENPHFSPDGKQLIFSSTRLGTSDIYESKLAGSDQRRITTTGGCSNPVWGPMR
jgi:TolB protein